MGHIQHNQSSTQNGPLTSYWLVTDDGDNEQYIGFAN